jgi:hypothetical protein
MAFGVPPQETEEDRLARAVLPEFGVEFPAAGQPNDVQADQEIPLPHPGTGGGGTRDDRHHLQPSRPALAQEAEPRPGRPAQDPTVPDEFIPLAAEQVHGNRQGSPGHLRQVQGDHPQHPALQVAQGAPAKARVGVLRRDAHFEVHTARDDLLR